MRDFEKLTKGAKMRPNRYPYKKPAIKQAEKGITYKFVNTEKSIFTNYHLDIVKTGKSIEIHIRV